MVSSINIEFVVPKVNFSINKKFDKEMLHCFINCKGVSEMHPRLATSLIGIKNKKKIKEIINKYVDNYYRNHKKQIIHKKLIFRKEWNKINSKVMDAISEVIEKEWDSRYVKAFISINPVCPRYLKDKVFSVTYSRSIKDMKAVVVHELIHFLYFEKWREVFPKDKIRWFDSPHLIWNLSEILIVPINKDQRIKKYFTMTHKAYRGFYKIKTKYKGKNISIVQYFTKLYFKNKKNKKSFADFLILCKKEIKRFETQIIQNKEPKF